MVIPILHEAAKADFNLLKCSCLHYNGSVLFSDDFDLGRTCISVGFKKYQRPTEIYVDRKC